jgi:hypothetical protein
MLFSIIFINNIDASNTKCHNNTAYQKVCYEYKNDYKNNLFKKSVINYYDKANKKIKNNNITVYTKKGYVYSNWYGLKNNKQSFYINSTYKKYKVTKNKNYLIYLTKKELNSKNQYIRVQTWYYNKHGQLKSNKYGNAKYINTSYLCNVVYKKNGYKYSSKGKKLDKWNNKYQVTACGSINASVDTKEYYPNHEAQIINVNQSNVKYTSSDIWLLGVSSKGLVSFYDTGKASVTISKDGYKSKVINFDIKNIFDVKSIKNESLEDLCDRIAYQTSNETNRYHVTEIDENNKEVTYYPLSNRANSVCQAIDNDENYYYGDTIYVDILFDKHKQDEMNVISIPIDAFDTNGEYNYDKVLPINSLQFSEDYSVPKKYQDYKFKFLNTYLPVSGYEDDMLIFSFWYNGEVSIYVDLDYFNNSKVITYEDYVNLMFSDLNKKIFNSLNTMRANNNLVKLNNNEQLNNAATLRAKEFFNRDANKTYQFLDKNNDGNAELISSNRSKQSLKELNNIASQVGYNKTINGELYIKNYYLYSDPSADSIYRIVDRLNQQKKTLLKNIYSDMGVGFYFDPYTGIIYVSVLFGAK